jgi:hypothetical protein
MTVTVTLTGGQGLARQDLSGRISYPNSRRPIRLKHTRARDVGEQHARLALLMSRAKTTRGVSGIKKDRRFMRPGVRGQRT